MLAELRGLDPKDRITPMLAALGRLSERQPRYGDSWVEHPDSDEAKPLAGLARSFGNALRPALRKAGWLTAQRRPAAAATARDLPRRRPRVARAAATRATARRGRWAFRACACTPMRRQPLGAEAGRSAADPAGRATSASACCAPACARADLGAAPGGWSWVLTRQGLRVTAIDNGPLRQHVLDSGLVEHLRADGFPWQPARPLDWMVCDMVEQPRRVAERMATWFREGWCRHAIFNLKLPMKKRWDETRAVPGTVRARKPSKPLVIRARAAVSRPRGNHRLRHVALSDVAAV